MLYKGLLTEHFLNSDELLPDLWLVIFFHPPAPKEIYDQGGTGIVNMFLYQGPTKSECVIHPV